MGAICDLIYWMEKSIQKLCSCVVFNLQVIVNLQPVA